MKESDKKNEDINLMNKFEVLQISKERINRGKL